MPYDKTHAEKMTEAIDAACIPSFAAPEYPIGEHKLPKTEIVRSAVKTGNGDLLIPDAPDIGIELTEDAETHPHKPGWVGTRLAADGSAIDQ